jgi:tetratricopeptide (TPR) repeat protein
MDVLKKVLEYLPVPVIFALAVVVAAGWGLKEYSGLPDYSQVMRNRGYQSFIVMVFLVLVGYYAITKLVYRPLPLFSGNEPGILIAEFSEDASGSSPANRALTQTILDEVSTIRDHAANSSYANSDLVKPFSRAIDPRSGREEALKMAREQRALAIVWGWYTKSGGAVLLKLHFDIVPENLAKTLKLKDPNETKNPEGLFQKEFSSMKRTFTIGDFDSFDFYFSTAESVEKISEFIVGFAKYAAGDFPGAKPHFERSARLAATSDQGALDFLSNFFLANCVYLSAKGTDNLVESLLYFERARNFIGSLSERRNEYQAKLLANEGAIYLSLGDLNEARSKTTSALESAPQLTAAVANLGIILYRQGDYESAIRYLRQAVTQNSDLLQARYFLVLSLYSGRHYEEARVEVKALEPYLTAYLQPFSAPRGTKGVAGQKAAPRDSAGGLIADPFGTSSDAPIDPEVLETYFSATDISKGIVILSRYAEANQKLSSVFSTMNPTLTFEHKAMADDARLRVANLYYDSGQLDEALKLYETLAAHSTKPLELHERLVSIYEKRQDQQALQRALIGYGTAAYTIRYCETYGLSADQERSLEKASDTALLRAISLQADDAQANFKLGLLAYRRADYERARANFLMAVKHESNVPDIQYMLGATLMHLQQPHDAIAEFLIAAKLDPKFAEAAHQLGYLYVSEGQWSEALHYLRAAEENQYGSERSECWRDWSIVEEKDNDQAGLQYLIAVALYKSGSLSEANTELSKYGLPGSVPSLELLMKIREQLGKTDEFAKIYLELGRFKSYKRDFVGAARAFQAAISHDPSSPTAYNYLAATQVLLNKIPDAQESLRKALELNPNYYGALVRTGHIYLGQGRDSDAERLLKRAKKVDTSKIAAQYLLGTLMLRAGRLEEALQEWESCLKVSYMSGSWGGYFGDLEIGSEYTEIMSAINLQLAAAYMRRQDYPAAASRLGEIFSGMAGDVDSLKADKYRTLAASLIKSGPAAQIETSADLLN